MLYSAVIHKNETEAMCCIPSKAASHIGLLIHCLFAKNHQHP